MIEVIMITNLKWRLEKYSDAQFFDTRAFTRTPKVAVDFFIEAGQALRDEAFF